MTNIRRQIRTARRALAAETRAQYSSSICRRISELESFKAANRIASYLAFDGEADPMELMLSAIAEERQIYLPIIVDKFKPLAFAPWTPSTTMVKNQFDILEPKAIPSELISAEQLDFVVTPLVGFDERCNRIGVGGGFYDRTFAFLNEPDHAKSVQLVGFAFELQKLPTIKPQQWDIRLDAVATESNLYR